MEVTFWGVRGSMPTPEKENIGVGGHTTSVEVRINDGTIIIFDAGTGITSLGKKLLKEFQDKPLPQINLFLTHTHWDHLHGFPFFAPIFVDNTEIVVYGPIKTKKSLEELIITEMDFDYCPIRYMELPSNITFIEIDEGTFHLNHNIKLSVSRHLHPGGAYSYRVEADGKVFVFNTDTEHYPYDLDQRVVDISRNADFMVHDAQYTKEELEDRIGWGHSSWEQAVQTAKEANVQVLGLTHHDPERTDAQIEELEKKVLQEFPNAFFCKEGMTFIL